MDTKRFTEENNELVAECLRLDTMIPEPSTCIGNFSDLNIANANENEELELGFIPVIVPDNTKNGSNSLLNFDLPPSDESEEPDEVNSGNFFLQLQEANNISKAAYKEIMTMAFETQTWVVGTLALGSLEEFLQMFRSPPPPGMKVECSIEGAVLPVAPVALVSFMMDPDRWASSLSLIVSRGSGHVPAGVLQKLKSTDETIKSIVMVNAEFQIPTPLLQTRKFCFLRCLREMIPNVWAIVDVSSDYFPNNSGDTPGFGSEKMCRRRPSGLIVRWHDNGSQVIWIENVEVFEGPSQYGTYSGTINSNLAFSAKRWVDTFTWRLKRNYSIFLNVNMHMNQKAVLFNLTDAMRTSYLDIVSETPNERKWVTLSNKDVRILRNMTVDQLSLNTYIAVTSFRLQAKPVAILDFLVKKNMDIQWPRLLNLEEPEEIIRLASEDGRNCITLHKKVVFQNDTTKGFKYLLQEVSNDGFCSLIVSTPMSQLDVNVSFFFRSSGVALLKPSGFAIMPDGPDGLHSDASLVTIAFQQDLKVPETDQAIEIMSGLIRGIVKETTEEVSRGNKTFK